MALTNSEALRAQCKLICNTCYVDKDVLALVLYSAGMDANATATANDPEIIRQAILIVKGWIETSRSENGISVSIDMDAVKTNILFWCKQAGLDASEFVDDMITLENGSDLW